MNNVVKKMVIFSMIGIIQIGSSASLLEASPLHNELTLQHQGEGGDRHDQDRRERERIENERHEREMKRRPNENDREWHERQRQEKERHEENLRRIAHDILELILDK